MVWPPVVEPTGGACKLATIGYSGQSVARTIRKVVHPCWTIRLVDNPQVGKLTINSFIDGTPSPPPILSHWTDRYAVPVRYPVEFKCEAKGGGGGGGQKTYNQKKASKKGFKKVA